MLNLKTNKMKITLDDFQIQPGLWIKEISCEHIRYNAYSYSYLYEGEHYDGLFSTSSSDDNEQRNIDLIDMILSDISMRRYIQLNG